MGNNKYTPTVTKDDMYVLAVSILVQLQELYNTTCKVIYNMLISTKDGDYFEKLTRYKIIEN